MSIKRMKITWTPEMDAILGTDRDAAIAGKLNLYGHQVEARRKVLGIPGYAVEPREWAPEEDAVLGTDSLVKISARLGRPTSQIQKRMKQLVGQPQKLSATPDLSGTVLPLCLIPNSALKSAPPFKSAAPRASACVELLA